MLNVLLRVPALNIDDLVDPREQHRSAIRQRIHSGLPAVLATSPPVRKLGPLLPIIDLSGRIIHEHDRLHPRGPGRRHYLAPGARDGSNGVG